MTADEKFAELGYSKRVESEYYVIFEKDSYHIYITPWTVDAWCDDDMIGLTNEEFKATYKKIEEKGW